MYCIYRITNKLNGKTYIGQHRYTDLSKDKYMGSGVYLWNSILKYGIENFEREILISDIKTKNEINELEKEYIDSERKLGHGEYNISRGGDGGWFLPGENHPMYGKHHSKDSIDKISNSLKGRPHSEETKNKQSRSLKGHLVTIDTRNKISKSNLGKRRSEEVKKKLSESHKNSNISDESRERMSHKGESHPMYGKHHSEISRYKMSQAKLGKPLSDEHRKHLSESRKGKSYYNNGLECHRYLPGTEPEGYVLGRLSRPIEELQNA